ncbi:MAG: response regulator transcription factor [Acidobacteria bacterium]|nr:response regulator transcription factor [Acidobacteriota bacterium]
MRVLVVEDSERLRKTLGEGLKREGYGVDQAADGEEALGFLQSYDYDAVVLDLMLPKMDGMSVLKSLRREKGKAFVLILSAKDKLDDRINGLQSGADDYLVKPFSFAELLARLQALIRRKYDQKSPQFKLGNVEVNTALRTIYVNEKELKLTKSEFSVLEVMLSNRGRVMSRETLFEHLYDGYVDVSSNVIDVHVCSLRRKLKARGAASLVRTKRGYGYYIEA